MARPSPTQKASVASSQTGSVTSRTPSRPTGRSSGCTGAIAVCSLPYVRAETPLFNRVAIPVLLLSGILLPMSIAPQWLQDVSNVNPLKHIVEGVRALFLGDLWVSTVVWGLVLTVVLVLVGTWYGTSTFRRGSS